MIRQTLCNTCRMDMCPKCKHESVRYFARSCCDGTQERGAECTNPLCDWEALWQNEG